MIIDSILFVSTLALGTYLIWLIYLDKYPIKQMYPFLFLVVAVQAISVLVSQLSLSSLGIKQPNITELLAYLLFLISAATITLIFAKYDKKDHFRLTNPLIKLGVTKSIFYILVSSFFQELIVKGYLNAELLHLNIDSVLVFTTLSGIFNAWPHIIFKDKTFLFGASLYGYLSSWLYFFFPNLILITIVHAIGGLLGVSLGYIDAEKYI
jgi:hypothetical protein